MIERKIDLEYLIRIFTFFVIGTLSLNILLYFNLEGSLLVNFVRIALLMIFVWSYEFVLLSLFIHYISKHKTEISVHFNKYKNLYQIIIGVIFYIGIIYFWKKDWLEVWDVVLNTIILGLGAYIFNKIFKILLKENVPLPQKPIHTKK